ncbi:pyrroloquinoline quinone-dependent dehydrogenase [Ramlibacter alkalitolerans]|uniref:PQQ-binding-like beta-propeller repeat protein n=1 Tax=Ramlibacter alkalitolerans TaxID=2039631 RepID=A0ABS1JIE3_9BURK|nr:PQQ-binding-like beta-propeller repeat protein [Ramlibacter alkalitolerans]MBL0423876.1 PQQ-binding-like beta-propeller repeat protein [Ramlibacter alkalitolerans]
MSKMKMSGLAGLALVASALLAPAARAADVDNRRLVDADKTPADWLTYHGTYKSWHYSGLDQINASNVGKLKVAWSHATPKSTRGLQTFPLVADGILYYSGAYNQLFALDGASGDLIWSFKQKLDDDLVSKQTHSPYNRGIALGMGNIYMGTLDGKLIAVDARTGQLKWETPLVDSKKLTVGFTGAPLFVNGKVIIGSQGGEWPYRGPIFGVDAATGKLAWTFLTVGGNDENDPARQTWGGDSLKTGGGGGWMAGGYDPKTNTVYWGTANPAPLYDWGGSEWKTKGARPGDNLYTTSVIALDPETGKLKSYHQELPHDAWDFDSAVGEFVMLERGGKEYIVHPNKGGFVFVYDRNLKIQNVWRGVKNINFVQNIDPKTGELIGRRDMAEGKHQALCPYIAGGYSWNAGTYNPNTGLYYKVGNEWCMDLEVIKTTPVLEPMAQLNIGSNFTVLKTTPDGGKARGHVTARDPLTGAIKWQVDYTEPPLASLLSTKGNLVFVPDARGYLRALDARTGKELWKHNNGQGHNGGIISYMAKGRQYIAVATGWGGLAGDDYKVLYGEPFASMPTDQGALVVFGL